MWTPFKCHGQGMVAKPNYAGKDQRMLFLVATIFKSSVSKHGHM